MHQHQDGRCRQKHQKDATSGVRTRGLLFAPAIHPWQNVGKRYDNHFTIDACWASSLATRFMYLFKTAVLFVIVFHESSQVKPHACTPEPWTQQWYTESWFTNSRFTVHDSRFTIARAQRESVMRVNDRYSWLYEDHAGWNRRTATFARCANYS